MTLFKELAGEIPLLGGPNRREFFQEKDGDGTETQGEPRELGTGPDSFSLTASGEPAH